MRVLVVEDEHLLADAIVDGLGRAGIAADVAYDGDSALEKAGVNDYDVLVLDRDLPVVHGDDVCRSLVGSGGPGSPAGSGGLAGSGGPAGSGGGVRILMLTASAEVPDRVEGLNLGADDYLTKPFAFDELIARVRVLARRTAPALPPVLSRGDIELDPAHREVRREHRHVPLSNKEFAVLEELLRAAGTVVSAEHLLEKVWDENIDPFTNVLRVTVMTLRRKLGSPPVIDTVTGVGYRIR